MSCSSLWVMDKNFNGECLKEFGNSWLFSPVARDILLEKYLPKKPFEHKMTYICATMFDKTLDKRLNDKINDSEIQEDRALWELSNQQIFFTKNKEFIADCIKKFLPINHKLATDLGEHIYKRYDEIADTILSIDEQDHPYFIFKNTSCDDNVEYWFQKYDEEKEEYENAPLTVLDRGVAEFVFIENNKINGFTNNIDYFSQK